jgi:hypothetical protein
VEPPAPAASAPASTPSSRPTTMTSAERIRQSLTRSRPLQPIVPALRPARAAEDGGTTTLPAGGRPAGPERAPAGDILIDRVVRIARGADGQWMEARFEADNSLLERPLPLLPCRLLEKAEALTGKVRITGVIRRYKGQDYLLLRKVIAERDMGQF